MKRYVLLYFYCKCSNESHINMFIQYFLWMITTYKLVHLNQRTDNHKQIKVSLVRKTLPNLYTSNFQTGFHLRISDLPSSILCYSIVLTDTLIWTQLLTNFPKRLSLRIVVCRGIENLEINFWGTLNQYNWVACVPAILKE